MAGPYSAQIQRALNDFVEGGCQGCGGGGGGITQLTGPVTAGPGSGSQATTLVSPLPAVSGVNLTALNASQLTSGGVPAARLAGLSFFGQLLDSPVWVFPLVSGIGTGDIDIYTVPSNTRAIVMLGGYYNNGLNTITATPQVKNAGTYYRLAASSGALSSGVGAVAANAFVLAAGESFSFNTTDTGLNAQMHVLEFADSSPLELATLYGPGATGHTLATAGAGEILVSAAMPVVPFFSSLSGITSGVLATTSSASSFNYFLYHVPAAGSIVAANRVSVTFSLAGNSASNAGAGCPMGVDENESIAVSVSVTSSAAMLRFAYWRLPK